MIDGILGRWEGPRIMHREHSRGMQRERVMVMGSPHFDYRADVPSPMEEMTALDLMAERSVYTGQHEFVVVQPTGKIKSLNNAAILAIKALLDTRIYEAQDRGDRPRGDHNFRDMTAYLVDGLQRAVEQGYNLNQMADDKVLPLFWRAVTSSELVAHPRRRGGPDEWLKAYSRDTAGDVIKIFRDRLGLSKNDWKALLRRSSAELFWHFKHNAPWEIYFPASVLQCREIGHPILLPDGPMHGWFTRRWNDPARMAHMRISPEEFTATIRDLADVMRFGTYYGRPIQEQFEQAHDWQELVRMAQYMEREAQTQQMTAREVQQRQAELYGRSPVASVMEDFRRGLAAIERASLDAMIHGTGMVDVRPGAVNYVPVFGGMDLAAPVPTAETVKKYDWMNELEHWIQFRGDFTACLIDSDFALLNEGQKMRHCIWDSYRARIERGEYLAYHISGPGLPKTGFTAGYKKHAPRPQGYEGMPEQSDYRWSLDQIRGVCNARTEDRNVLELADLIADTLNGKGPALYERTDI